MYKKQYMRKGRRAPLKKAGKQVAKAKAYTRPAKMANVVALAKQVNSIKKQIHRDTEVKQYTPADIFADIVGQVNINSTGAVAYDLEPCNIGAGVDVDTRVGNQVKMLGMHFRGQITNQSQTSLRQRIYIDIWKTTDYGVTATSLANLVYKPDSLSGQIDGNSTLDHDYVKNGQYKLICRKVYTLAEDAFSGANVQFKDFKFFVKTNQILNYAGSATDVPQNFRYICVIRAQHGNKNSTTPSTLSTIPVQIANSGSLVRMQHTDYYIDK